MPEDGIDNLIAQFQGSGRSDSSGVFTMSPEKAREKLSQFQLAEPHFYVQNLVSAALLGGATTLQFTIDRAGCRAFFDGQTYTEEQLQTLLNQLLNTTCPALYELAVALNTFRRVKGLKATFCSVSQEGEGAWLLLDGETFQLDRPPNELTAGNYFQVHQPFRVTRLLDGWLGGYREAQILWETCRHAPLSLLLNERNIQVPITTATSVGCVGWLRLNLPKGAQPIIEPETNWFPDCIEIPPPILPEKNFGCVLALSSRETAQASGFLLLCNGVRYQRSVELLDVPFVHGVAWGPLDKNVSQTDLTENKKYQELVGKLRLLAEHMIVERMQSNKPIPSGHVAPLLRWSSTLVNRLNARGDFESAKKVDLWLKETRFLQDLNDETSWQILTRSLQQITNPAERSRQETRIATILLQAMEMSFQSASYTDCEGLCSKLVSLKAPQPEIAPISVALRAVCGSELGNIESLEVELRAHCLRINGLTQDAASLPLVPQNKGQVLLAVEQFRAAEKQLRQAWQEDPETLEALSDCLAVSQGKSLRKEALELREKAIALRVEAGLPPGAFLKQDLARQARGAMPLTQWIRYRVAASLAEAPPSVEGKKLEADLEKALAGLGRTPMAPISIKSILLNAERVFSPCHVFLQAARARCVHNLRRASLWQEADTIVARGKLLDFILRRIHSLRDPVKS